MQEQTTYFIAAMAKVGSSVLSLSKRFLVFNLISLGFILINIILNTPEEVVMFSFTNMTQSPIISALIFTNIILLLLFFYAGTLFVDLQYKIKDFTVPSNFNEIELKINVSSVLGLMKSLDTISDIKEHIMLISLFFSPFSFFAFLICFVSTFVYMLSSFLILVF